MAFEGVRMEGRQHLVVVLPGIGGTQLAVPDSSGRPTKDLVWAAGLKDVDLLRRPERLSIGEYEHLAPKGLIPTRTAFGLWTMVPGYDRLLKRLGRMPGAVLDDATSPEPILKANVVAVGYDFRRSIAEAAQRLDDQVRSRLDALWPGQPHTDRVLILAHSMGGLVARYWIAESEGAADLCRGLITLGTPHRGAPKALEVLANGIPLPVHGYLRRPREVMRRWPGATELLPRYRAVKDERDGTLKYPSELELPWLVGPARDALTVHERIEAGWARIGTPPALSPRIGFGHATLRRCLWDGNRVSVTKESPEGPDLGGWNRDQGDGTVPAFCAQPLERDKSPRLGLRVPERHGPMAELAEVEEMIRWFESDPSLAFYRASEAVPVVLGVDLDELCLADTPIEVRARVLVPDELAPQDPAEEAVWARLSEVRGSDVRLEWDSDDGTYRGVLAGPAPGLYQVVVQAEEVAGGLRTEQGVEVLNDDGLE